MTFTEITSGVDTSFSTKLNDNFYRSILLTDESSEDTGTYTTTSATKTLLRTYTLTPTITNAVLFGIKVKYDAQYTGGSVGTWYIDVSDGTNDYTAWENAGGSSSHDVEFTKFLPACMEGSTVKIELSALAAASNTIGFKDITVTFYYMQGGIKTTTSAKIVGA